MGKPTLNDFKLAGDTIVINDTVRMRRTTKVDRVGYTFSLYNLDTTLDASIATFSEWVASCKAQAVEQGYDPKSLRICLEHEGCYECSGGYSEAYMQGSRPETDVEFMNRAQVRARDMQKLVKKQERERAEYERLKKIFEVKTPSKE